MSHWLCKRVGKNAIHWKGGRNISIAGYVRIRNGYKYVFEHRLIMERHLGRILESQEQVHHINGVKDDNRIENLEIVTAAKHQRIHRTKYKPIKCFHCGKFFKPKSEKTKYCSRYCGHANRWGWVER